MLFSKCEITYSTNLTHLMNLMCNTPNEARITADVDLREISAIGYFTFRKYHCSYGDTVVTSCCGKTDRDGAITDVLFLTQ